MKLSEILGWDKKAEKPKGEANTPYSYGAYREHNSVLTSCDREIDREALINEIRVFRNGTYPEFSSIQFADHIISTMPTWLKRGEDNGR